MTSLSQTLRETKTLWYTLTAGDALMTYAQLLAMLAVIITVPVFSTAAPTQPSDQDTAPMLRPQHERAPTREYQQILELGWQAYRRGDIAAALASYRRVVEVLPNDASLWYDLGCLHALNHETDRARDALHRALTLDPRLAAAHDALGQLTEQAGDTQAARALYATANAIEPVNAKYLRHLARALLRLNDTDSARKALQDLVMFEPNDVDARYQLGLLELRADAPDLAIHEFRKVLDHAPKHALALNGLALAYLHLGDVAQASSTLQQANTVDPNNASIHTNLGLVAAQQQRWDEARSAWQRALQLNPQYAPAAENLKVLDAMTTSSTP